jgi:hypothetical protein
MHRQVGPADSLLSSCAHQQSSRFNQRAPHCEMYPSIVLHTLQFQARPREMPCANRGPWPSPARGRTAKKVVWHTAWRWEPSCHRWRAETSFSVSVETNMAETYRLSPDSANDEVPPVTQLKGDTRHDHGISPTSAVPDPTVRWWIANNVESASGIDLALTRPHSL